MKKIYFDLISGKHFGEKEIRKESLRYECNDILNNLEEYENGILSIDAQIDFIRNSVYGDIDTLVDNLNTSGFYSLTEVNEENIKFMFKQIMGSDNLDYIKDLLKKIEEIKTLEIKGE